MEKICIASSYFESEIQKRVESNNLDSTMAKLSKYMDQIVLSILRIGPNELMDKYVYIYCSEQTLLIPKQLHAKLDHLLSLHQGCQNIKIRAYL